MLLNKQESLDALIDATNQICFQEKNMGNMLHLPSHSLYLSAKYMVKIYGYDKLLFTHIESGR